MEELVSVDLVSIVRLNNGYLHRACRHIHASTNVTMDQAYGNDNNAS
jgi:hypothetical protein